MSLEKSLESFSKNLKLMNDDISSMLAKDDPKEASRKSLEPSVRLQSSIKEEEPSSSNSTEEKAQYILKYIEDRLGDML